MILHTKFKALGLVVSDKKIFFMLLPIQAYVRRVTPEPGHFWPQGYNLNKLGTGPLDDTTYLLSRL